MNNQWLEIAHQKLYLAKSKNIIIELVNLLVFQKFKHCWMQNVPKNKAKICPRTLGHWLGRGERLE